MRGRICCFLLMVQIVSWVSATSRPFAPNDGHGVHQPGTAMSPQTSQVTFGPKQGLIKSRQGVGERKEAAYYRAMGKIGSHPPSCEHKCFGCIPCEAIQVPTTSSRMGIQYANYEPEGWKCKCGPSFYSP